MENSSWDGELPVYITLGGSIEWRLPSDATPPEFKTAEPRSYTLLNPLLVQTGDPTEKVPAIGPLPDGTVLFSSNALYVRLPGPYNGERPLNREHVATIEKWLRQIRFLSRQFSIPRSPPTYTFGARTELGPRPALELRPPENLFMQEHLARTAVGVEILERVLASPVDVQVPLAAEIMLDALEARTHRDYKKAILYAAIAAESALSGHLDQEYEKILQTGLGCARFRVTERTLAGGRVKREDPVYAAIPETFKSLLHERSLYVLGRSILLEDEDIYRQAVKLYKTRNLLPPAAQERRSRTSIRSTSREPSELWQSRFGYSSGPATSDRTSSRMAW